MGQLVTTTLIIWAIVGLGLINFLVVRHGVVPEPDVKRSLLRTSTHNIEIEPQQQNSQIDPPMNVRMRSMKNSISPPVVFKKDDSVPIQKVEATHSHNKAQSSELSIEAHKEQTIEPKNPEDIDDIIDPMIRSERQ